MSRFDFYVLERQIAVFVLLTGMLIVIFWINFTARGLSSFLADTQAIKLLLLYTFLDLPDSLYRALILGAYIPALYTAYRLYADRELWALQAAGASPARLLAPFLAFGILMITISSFLVHDILPNSRALGSEVRVRLQTDISQFRIKPGEFLFPADEIAFYVRDRSESGELLDVFLHHGKRGGQEVTYIAETARMVEAGDQTLFEMQSGSTQIWDPDTDSIRIIQFEKARFNLSELARELSGSLRIERLTNSASLLNQLQQDEATTDHAKIQSTYAEIHRRVTYSLMTFLFPLIGAASVTASEALRFRRFVPIIVSPVMIAALFILNNHFHNLVISTQAPMILMYVPSILGILCIAVMTVVALKPYRFQFPGKRHMA